MKQQSDNKLSHKSDNKLTSYRSELKRLKHGGQNISVDIFGYFLYFIAKYLLKQPKILINNFLECMSVSSASFFSSPRSEGWRSYRGPNQQASAIIFLETVAKTLVHIVLGRRFFLVPNPIFFSVKYVSPTDIVKMISSLQAASQSLPLTWGNGPALWRGVALRCRVSPR